MAAYSSSYEMRDHNGESVTVLNEQPKSERSGGSRDKDELVKLGKAPVLQVSPFSVPTEDDAYAKGGAN